MADPLESLMRKVSGTPAWKQHGGFLRAHRTLQRTFDQSNAIAPLKGASLKQWLQVAEPLVLRHAKLHGGAMPEEDEDEEGEEEDDELRDAREGDGDEPESEGEGEAEAEGEEGTGAAAEHAAAAMPHDLLDLETGAPSDAAPAHPDDLAQMEYEQPEAAADDAYDEADAPPDVLPAEAGHDETVAAAEAEAPAAEDEGTVSAPFQKRLAALHALLQRAPQAAPESAAAAAMPSAPDVIPTPTPTGGALGTGGRGVRKALPLFPSAAVAAAGGGLRRAKHSTVAQQMGGAMRGGAPLPLPLPQGSMASLEQLSSTGRPGMRIAPGNVIQYGYGGSQKPTEVMGPSASRRR